MERSRVRRETRVNGTQPERIVDAKLGPRKNGDPEKIGTQQKLGPSLQTSNFVKLPAATTECGRDSMVVVTERVEPMCHETSISMNSPQTPGH